MCTCTHVHMYLYACENVTSVTTLIDMYDSTRRIDVCDMADTNQPLE